MNDYSLSTPDSPVGTFVSTYAGAGGMDLGFIWAGFKPLWANELSADAAATHDLAVERLARSVPWLDGTPGVQTGDIAQRSGMPAPGTVDVVVGGPPCQSFSVAGKMDPNDPRGKQLWNFLAVVQEVQPRAFVMENVKNLAVNPRWQDVRWMVEERTRALGYTPHLFLLNAADFDVPQARERMFLVGTRGFSACAPAAVTTSCRPTVRDAFASLPRWGEPGNDSVCNARITLASNPVLRPSPYAGMLLNGAGRPLDLDAPAYTLPASMGGNRTPVVDQDSLDNRSEPWIVSYHRSIVCGERPGGEVPRRLRRLTVEEAAALQTFPADMEWQGAQTAKFRQIGNAVPPNLAYHVALSVRRSLAGEGDAAEWLNSQPLFPA